MREILPRLHHWTTEHPNLGQAVSSYYVEDAATLLDPMVPEEGLEAFDDLAPPERVVLSCRHHDRDHEQFVQAFGASFHVDEAGVHEYEGEEVQPFAIGDEPAAGVKALANGPIAPDDTVLRIDVEGGALLFADSLLSSDGALGFMPDGLLGEYPEIRSSAHATLRRFVDEQRSAR